MNVRQNEEKALRLVAQYAPEIPVPSVYGFSITNDADGDPVGKLFLSFIVGETLGSVWPGLDKHAKQKVCRDTWELIDKLRRIPRPEALDRSAYYTTVDGSSIRHPMLGHNRDICPILESDQALRERIFERFKAHNGLSHPDGKDLPEMLPRSDRSVFTHGDIHPYNILVDKRAQIVGLLDFESAGFFPDYWEYGMMMRPMREDDDEWQDCMAETKPRDKNWDISGLAKARRVLF